MKKNKLFIVVSLLVLTVVLSSCYKKDFEETSKKLDEEIVRNEALEQENSDLESEIKSSEESLKELKKDLEAKDKDLSDLKERLEKLEKDLKVKDEKIKDLEKQIEDLGVDLEKTEKEKEEAKKYTLSESAQKFEYAYNDKKDKGISANDLLGYFELALDMNYEDIRNLDIGKMSSKISGSKNLIVYDDVIAFSAPKERAKVDTIEVYEGINSSLMGTGKNVIHMIFPSKAVDVFENATYTVETFDLGKYKLKLFFGKDENEPLKKAIISK